MKADNELIAKFMGLPLTKEMPEFGTGNWKEVPFQRWKYHSSWDWLMPVVIKCHELTEAKEKEFPDTKDIDNPTGWRAWSYRRVGLSTDINRTYKNVVNFLEWLNQQKVTLDSTLR